MAPAKREKRRTTALIYGFILVHLDRRRDRSIDLHTCKNAIIFQNYQLEFNKCFDLLQKIAEKLKNIILLTFLFLLISCSPEVKTASDWSDVDTKIRRKDSLGAERLVKKVAPAIQTWSGYPDVKKQIDTTEVLPDEAQSPSP